jgi:hypothetical protein
MSRHQTVVPGAYLEPNAISPEPINLRTLAGVRDANGAMAPFEEVSNLGKDPPGSDAFEFRLGNASVLCWPLSMGGFSGVFR